VRTLRYTDFDLRLEREGSRYTVRVLESPAGEASSSFVLPFSADRIENLILKIGRRLGGGVRRVHSDEMEAARELGGSLFEALFTGAVRDCYTRSLDEVTRNEGSGLRLRLRLQDVPELADLPWEFLLDKSGGRFLAQSAQTPVIRYMEMPQSVRPVTTTLPLRVLVMISAPVDVPQLDLAKERDRLEQALAPLRDQGKVHVTWQEDATLTALMRYLRKETYHVFHFVGHGAFDPKREVGLLLLEDEKERSFPVESDRIGAFLHDHPSLRLAVLNSCEGARSSRNDPFAGVAANLVRQGIPAVVAMQFEISDDAAITFSGEFYAALAEGLPVDAAVAEARKAIYATNDVEWATPVLYMRSESGLLFKLEEPPPTATRASTEQRRAALASRQEQERRELEAREARRARATPQHPARATPQAVPARATPEPRVKPVGRPPDNSLHKVFIWSGAIFGLIVVLGVAAALLIPRPPTPGSFDIPPLAANVAAIRFFESGATPPFKTERVYRTTFESAATRFINIELELQHRPPVGVLSASIPCAFYREDGTVEGRVDLTGDLQPGDTESWLARGWGNREGGTWGAGTYSVTCTSDGKTVVASETFTVSGAVAVAPPPPPPPPPPPRPRPPAAPRTPAYDIPALRARVTGMRFFEGPDPPPDNPQRVFSKRFSRNSARYIYLQLYVVYPSPARVLEYPIECTYFHDGVEWAQVGLTMQIQPDWTSSWHWAGRGWQNSGQWLTGNYRVKCMVDGRVVSDDGFEVN